MTNNEEEKDGIAPIKPIIKKLKKEYDKDPTDWRVIGSKDEHGKCLLA